MAFILFQKDYFSYLDSSIHYKDKIIQFIDENIQTFPARKTPIQLKNYGSKYIFYKSNSRTTEYVFFEQKESNFVITNIINNNSEEIKWLKI